VANVGRPPVPTERKRRTGNPGKRPLPATTELVAVDPVDPDVLDSAPRATLERGLLAGAAWLADSDSPTVFLARDALEFYADLRANPLSKPADVTAAGKWVQSLFSELGFTPGERARLGLAEVKAVSKLEELRARKVADASS
jgi:hypothetical protein